MSTPPAQNQKPSSNKASMPATPPPSPTVNAAQSAARNMIANFALKNVQPKKESK